MYVGGFVLAVKTDRKDDYAGMARVAGEVFKDHGARRVVECWGDDVPDGALTSFGLAVKAEPDETVVFSWMEFPDKAAYEACMAASETDARLAEPTDLTIMDPKRMIWGGFAAIVDF